MCSVCITWIFAKCKVLSSNSLSQNKICLLRAAGFELAWTENQNQIDERRSNSAMCAETYDSRYWKRTCPYLQELTMAPLRGNEGEWCMSQSWTQPTKSASAWGKNRNSKKKIECSIFLFSSYDSDRHTFGSALHQVSRAALPACMAAWAHFAVSVADIFNFKFYIYRLPGRLRRGHCTLHS